MDPQCDVLGVCAHHKNSYTTSYWGYRTYEEYAFWDAVVKKEKEKKKER